MENLFKKDYSCRINTFNFNGYNDSRRNELGDDLNKIETQVDMTLDNVYLSKKLDKVLIKSLSTITGNLKRESGKSLLLFTLSIEFFIELDLKRKLKSPDDFSPDIEKLRCLSIQKIVPEINAFLSKTSYSFIELPNNVDID